MLGSSVGNHRLMLMFLVSVLEKEKQEEDLLTLFQLPRKQALQVGYSLEGLA